MHKQRVAGIWFSVKLVAHRFGNIAERIATLAPLREILEPKPHKWQPGFKLEDRAHTSTTLHPKSAKHWEKSIRKAKRARTKSRSHK